MNDVICVPSNSLIAFTRYSFINTTITTCIVILLLIFITNRIKFLPKINISFTYLAVFLIGIRLLTPFEFYFTRAINSYTFMHKVKEITDMPVLYINTSRHIDVLHVLCFIWLSGAVICLFKYFFGYYLLCRKSELMIPSEDETINKILTYIKNKYGFKFSTKVVVFHDITVPSEFGFFKQTIFLNDYKYSDEELYYILLHELVHFYNKSNRVNVFMSVVSCIYWWNPIVRLFKDHVNELIETYVDDYITRESSYEEKGRYLKCVFKVYNVIEDNNYELNSVTESIIGPGSKNILLNRFKIVYYNKKINIPICILLLFIIIFYFIYSERYVVQNAEEPPMEDMNISSMINADNSYIVKENNVYILYYNGNELMRNSNPEDLPDVPYVSK